jgi:hypothetical protein
MTPSAAKTPCPKCEGVDVPELIRRFSELRFNLEQILQRGLTPNVVTRAKAALKEMS